MAGKTIFSYFENVNAQDKLTGLGRDGFCSENFLE